MGRLAVYCTVSGCTPEIAKELAYQSALNEYGPIVTSAFEALARDELGSSTEPCVIGPIHPSGQPYTDAEGSQDDLRACDLHPETDIRVVTRCVAGKSWDFGFVDRPFGDKESWSYLVAYGCKVMVQAHGLDILALATRGRMTPLRLWHLAMQQGFEDMGRHYGLEDVNYGEIEAYWDDSPEVFPEFTGPEQVFELEEELGEVEAVKQCLVHEGGFWLWMAPDRFPVSPSEGESPLWLPEVQPSAARPTIGNLPTEVLTRIASHLPITSLLDLAVTSRALRTSILGYDYLASVWIYNNAPWWIPVPTQMPKQDQTADPQAYPASEWGAHVQLTTGFPAGLGWAYIWRCMRSGSMRNRKRVWNAALDIERVANLVGV